MKVKVNQNKQDRGGLNFSAINIENLGLPLVQNKLLESALELAEETKTKKKFKTVSSKQLDTQIEDILRQFDNEEILELFISMFEVDFYHCSSHLLEKVIAKTMSFINTARNEALKVIYMIFSVRRPVPLYIITEQFLLTLVKLTRSPDITSSNRLSVVQVESVSCNSKLIFIIFSRIYMLFRDQAMFFKIIQFLNNECSVQATNQYLLFFLYVLKNNPKTLPNDKLFFRLFTNRVLYSQQKYMFCIMKLWKQMLARPNPVQPSTNSFAVISVRSFRNILIDQKYSSLYSSLYELLIYLLKRYKQQIGLTMMQQIYPTLLSKSKINSTTNLSLVLTLIQNSIQSSTYLKHKISEHITNLNFEITFNTNPLNIAKLLKGLQELCSTEDAWVFDDTNFENTLQNLLKSNDYLIKQAAMQTKKKFYKN